VLWLWTGWASEQDLASYLRHNRSCSRSYFLGNWLHSCIRLFRAGLCTSTISLYQVNRWKRLCRYVNRISHCPRFSFGGRSFYRTSRISVSILVISNDSVYYIYYLDVKAGDFRKHELCKHLLFLTAYIIGHLLVSTVLFVKRRVIAEEKVHKDCSCDHSKRESTECSWFSFSSSSKSELLGPNGTGSCRLDVLQRIRGVTLMRYINLHFTYLLPVTQLTVSKHVIKLPSTDSHEFFPSGRNYELCLCWLSNTSTVPMVRKGRKVVILK